MANEERSDERKVFSYAGWRYVALRRFVVVPSFNLLTSSFITDSAYLAESTSTPYSAKSLPSRLSITEPPVVPTTFGELVRRRFFF